MKRCPICSSFASNDATTCFDCLYSFEHMTSLADETDAPSQAAKIEQIVIPAPPPKTVSKPAAKATPATAATVSPPRSAPSKAAPPKDARATVITIRIDCTDGEVRIDDRR